MYPTAKRNPLDVRVPDDLVLPGDLPTMCQEGYNLRARYWHACWRVDLANPEWQALSPIEKARTWEKVAELSKESAKVEQEAYRAHLDACERCRKYTENPFNINFDIPDPRQTNEYFWAMLKKLEAKDGR